MIPKEKAKELVDKMYMIDDPIGNYPMCFDTAKQCALIAVDEIINSVDNEHVSDIYNEFWENVKQEIEQL